MRTGHVCEEHEALAKTFDSAADDLYVAARLDHPAQPTNRLLSQ